jgi:hypothetical protein
VRAEAKVRSAGAQENRQLGSEGLAPGRHGADPLVHERALQARAEREEAEARTRLLHQEAQRAKAETRLIEAGVALREAETEHTEAETGDLDFAIFRQAVFFVLALSIAVLIIVRLLADPDFLGAVGGSGLVTASLIWLGRRG